MSHSRAGYKILEENQQKNDKYLGMNEIAQSLLRHGLTTAGGTLVSKGLLTTDDLSTSVGAVLTLIGVIWSVISKKKKDV